MIKKPRTAIGVAILVVLSLLVLIGNWLGRTSVPERPSTSKPQDISAAGADRGVPSATLPESAPRAAEASGQSKAIAAAKASILDLSKEFESKNAKWIFHRMLGKTEWAVVALGAPDEDQIAAVSNRLTQIIQAAPADQQDRLRSELQSLYRNAVSYLATHKVLYFMSPEAPAPPALMIADMTDDDLNKMIANMDALGKAASPEEIPIEITAKSTAISSNLLDRYSHLLSTAPPISQ